MPIGSMTSGFASRPVGAALGDVLGADAKRRASLRGRDSAARLGTGSGVSVSRTTASAAVRQAGGQEIHRGQPVTATNCVRRMINSFGAPTI